MPATLRAGSAIRKLCYVIKKVSADAETFFYYVHLRSKSTEDERGSMPRSFSYLIKHFIDCADKRVN